MATYYIDPSAATNGTGTTASPYNDPASAPLAAGNEYAFIRGSTWTGAFPSLTNGTSGNLTLIRAYANLDGTDDASLPKPIIDIGDRQMPGTLGSPKTFLKWQSVDLKNSRSAITSDTPMMWLGNDVEFNDCGLDTNLTALYGENKSRIKIKNCRITACAATSTTAAMNAIVIAGTAAMTGIDIDGVDILIGDGGPSNCHAIKIGGSVAMTDLKVKNVNVRTISGLPTTHVNKAGVFVSNVSGADLFGSTGTTAATVEISGIDVRDLVDGIFTSSVSGAWIHHCILDWNSSFGLHSTGSTSGPSAGCIIEWNKTRYNGRNVSPWYGRGIELSGGGGLHACTGHIVRFNESSFNFNWGGPGDNGTEGIGIGFDDATSFTLAYGNYCEGNEGQAVQFYGGYAPPSDTGGNIVTCNHFINNGAASIWNRRTGGTYKTGGACNISLANTLGSKTIIAYNVIVGSFGGLRESSECTNVEKNNNVFIGQTGYAQAFNVVYSRPDDLGTYFDSAGVLKTAARGTQRVTYDPADLTAPPRVLIEAAATNLTPYSEQIGAATGWLFNTTTDTANQTLSPDGQTTADLMTIIGSSPFIYREYSVSPLTTYTFSTHAKMGTLAEADFKFAFYDATGLVFVAMDIAPEVSTDAGGGFKRHSYSVTTPAGCTTLRCYPFRNGSVSTGTFYLYGVMFNVGALSSYIKTEATAVTRAADTPNSSNNIHTPGIPKNIGSLALDGNNSPTPVLVSTGLLGDLTTDPLFDANYMPLAGSPLLGRSVQWAPVPKIV